MSETVQTKENTEPGFFSDVVDGLAGAVMLKNDVVLDNFGKRVGAMLPGAALGMFAHGRIMVKKGLRQIDKRDADRVVAAIPLGSLTIGKL